jgi:molecular chaperone GrpE (heat shock protein)
MNGVNKIAFILFLLILSSGICLAKAPTQIQSSDIILIIDNSRSMINLNKNILSNFIKAISKENWISIISFGNDAKILYSLKQIPADKEETVIESIFAEINFTEPYTNINSGLESAFSIITNQGRDNTKKSVILLSDGLMDPPPQKGLKDKYLNELSEKILPDYINNDITIYTVAYGEKVDILLMEKIADKTKGICLTAPNSKILENILPIISEKVQPKVLTKTLQKPAITVSNSLILLLIIILGILIILTFVTIIFLLISTRYPKLHGALQPSQRKKKDDGILPVKVNEGLNRIKNLISDANSNISEFQLDVEDYVAMNWQRERDFDEKYSFILRKLFFLLDHCDNFVKLGKYTDEIKWFHKSILEILENEKIEKMPVKQGDLFDSMYHKCIGERPTVYQKGTIIENTRIGYYKKGKTNEDDIILRPAEVIISSGTPVIQSESNQKKEN